MKFFFKFGFYFTISFLILSAPFENQTFFNSLHERTAPWTDQAFLKAYKGLQRGWAWGVQVFTNSRPDEGTSIVLKEEVEDVDIQASEELGQNQNLQKFRESGLLSQDLLVGDALSSRQGFAQRKSKAQKKVEKSSAQESYTPEEQALLKKILEQN